MRPYLMWTADEWALVARAYFPLREEGFSRQEAFWRAQAELPSERQKRKTQVNAQLSDKLVRVAGRAHDNFVRRLKTPLPERMAVLEKRLIALEERVELIVQALLPKADRHKPSVELPPAPPSPPPAPRVCIIGIRANQQSFIQSRFGRRFDLRCFEPEASHFDSCARAERILIMEGHVTNDKLKQLKRLGPKILYVNGSESALIRTLDTLEETLRE